MHAVLSFLTCSVKRDSFNLAGLKSVRGTKRDEQE